MTQNVPKNRKNKKMMTMTKMIIKKEVSVAYIIVAENTEKAVMILLKSLQRQVCYVPSRGKLTTHSQRITGLALWVSHVILPI